MGAGQGDGTRECVLVHTDPAAGGPGPAALAEMIQDIEGLCVGQSGLLQDGALALGEADLAGAARDPPDPPGRAAVAAEGEISEAPAAGIRASGILATEVFDGMHVAPS